MNNNLKLISAESQGEINICNVGYDDKSVKDISKLEKKLISFIENNKQLFRQRIAENKIMNGSSTILINKINRFV